ncbi:MAG: preprotein translocase subunit SecG [Candidatus Dasytiphilus stammeri]
MHNIILAIFLIVAIILISLILIHHSSGTGGIGTPSSNFTNASSTTFFGSHGSKNFLNRILTLFAFIFLITTLILDNMVYNTEDQWSNIKPSNNVNNQKLY